MLHHAWLPRTLERNPQKQIPKRLPKNDPLVVSEYKVHFGGSTFRILPGLRFRNSHKQIGAHFEAKCLQLLCRATGAAETRWFKSLNPKP